MRTRRKKAPSPPRFRPNCSALICPRVSNSKLPYRVPAGELGRDLAGYCWCNYCWKQLEVMNWASLNYWPTVRVQGMRIYAVYQGKDSWFLSVVGASEDMVSALHETLVEGKREPLPPGGDSEGVKRVQQFIEMVEKKPGKGEED